MAMRKEPARRYATADQMAADVRRHFEGLPVNALPDTWRYRTRKFIRRHRAAVSAVAALVLVLLAFSVVTAIQSQRLRQQSSRIAQERDKAEQAETFFTELFRVPDPGVARGRAVTAQELLDRGARRLEWELATRPEVRGRMMDAMGRAYFGLGLFDEARSLLEGTLVLRRQIHGSEHPDVATSLYNLAYVRRNPRPSVGLSVFPAQKDGERGSWSREAIGSRWMARRDVCCRSNSAARLST